MILEMARGHLDFVYDKVKYRIQGEMLLHGESDIEFVAYRNTLRSDGGGAADLDEGTLRVMFEALNEEFRRANRVLTLEE